MNSLNSPIIGLCVAIENVPDEVFSQKILGDGIAVEPTDNKVVSPFDGEVIQLAPTNHAITIKSAQGLTLLIHVGIDTVNLKGKGFKAKVKVNDKIKKNQTLIEFDLDYLAQNAKALTSPIIVLPENGWGEVSDKSKHGEFLNHQSRILDLETLGQKINEHVYKETPSAKKKVRIENPSGLHARPCARITNLAKRFDATATIENLASGKKANAASVVELLSLSLTVNEEIEISASGKEASMAVEAIFKLITEEINLEHNEHATFTTNDTFIQRTDTDKIFYGISAARGIAIGNVKILAEDKIILVDESDSNGTDIEVYKVEQKKKFLDAISAIKLEVQKQVEKLRDNKREDQASIFTAHIELLEDPGLIDSALNEIEKGISAQRAWHDAYNAQYETLKNLANELLQARANDIQDIGRRVLYKIQGVEAKGLNDISSDNTILIAKSLTPSQTLKLDIDKVKGLVTTTGGATSHVAILARSMGIASIVGVSEKVLDFKNDETIILNATEGFIKRNPTAEQILKYEELKKIESDKKTKALLRSHESAFTTDNKHIDVYANIASAQEAQEARKLGADGVGLFRSEFIFMGKNASPLKEEQVEIYKTASQLLDKNQKKEIIIRTLDIGGDKPLNYISVDKEDNPFLGMRGIRISFEYIEIFKTQIEAILKANTNGNIKIMFPMITHINELIKAKDIVRELQKKYQYPEIKIGMMVEVPSAAIMADLFAPHVDFFSIGANDLTQYTLATDRGHDKLSKTADGLEPSILRLIDLTCKAAKQFNIPVGVCGGIAGDFEAIPILIGLGVTELSVSIPLIPQVKEMVRNISMSECQKLASLCLSESAAINVRQLISKEVSYVN